MCDTVFSTSTVIVTAKVTCNTDLHNIEPHLERIGYINWTVIITARRPEGAVWFFAIFSCIQSVEMCAKLVFLTSLLTAFLIAGMLSIFNGSLSACGIWGIPFQIGHYFASLSTKRFVYFKIFFCCIVVYKLRIRT